MSLSFNLAALLVDVATLAIIARYRSSRAVVWGWLVAAVLVMSLCPWFATGGFHLLRLAAFGVFLHAPLVALGSAWLLRAQRRLAIGCSGVAAVLASIAVDAFVIEPRWLEVTHVELTSSKIEKQLRIVVVADLQTDTIGDYERRVLRRVLDAEPDLILLPGDFIQQHEVEAWEQLRHELNAYLKESRFSAPLGAHAVSGNVDASDWERIFDGVDVRCYQQTQTIQVGELALTAVTKGDSFNRRLRLSGRPDRFHVAFGHAPDFALGDVDADLLIAGHTHGGQVRLPFIGPLMTLSQVPRAWAAGVSRLDGDRTLIVSRGIGMERGAAPRLRFLCRPELVVVDVLPATR